MQKTSIECGIAVNRLLRCRLFYCFFSIVPLNYREFNMLATHCVVNFLMMPFH